MCQLQNCQKRQKTGLSNTISGIETWLQEVQVQQSDYPKVQTLGLKVWWFIELGKAKRAIDEYVLFFWVFGSLIPLNDISIYNSLPRVPIARLQIILKQH